MAAIASSILIGLWLCLLSATNTTPGANEGRLTCMFVASEESNARLIGTYVIQPIRCFSYSQ